MTDQEKFMALIANEPLKKSDAIVVLEGDGYFRLPKAVELYRQGWAKKIAVSGGLWGRDNFPAEMIAEKLVKLGVSGRDIILEDRSLNTREQAVNIMALAKKKNWKKILLVASNYHQYRAYLTFLKAMGELKLKIKIINAPAGNLPWFENNKWGARFDLLEAEFEKIKQYKKHVAGFKQAIEYQKWKELKK